MILISFRRLAAVDATFTAKSKHSLPSGRFSSLRADKFDDYLELAFTTMLTAISSSHTVPP